ncbi:hypothetical protein ACPV4A_16700 [Vibrio rotiferianus]|uniref:hypothetical protein n=1 Tax=Vibrio rotiferianus TaxID=190895 RepID=UPI00406A8727
MNTKNRIYLCLSCALISSPIAYAKPSCNIESIQSVDITPETKASVLEKEDGQLLITQKAMTRCANITFTTAHTRNRIAHMMDQSFEATFFDGQQATSRSVVFDEDDLKAGYIKIGPNHPKSAFVCFTTSETPIKDITCDVK